MIGELFLKSLLILWMYAFLDPVETTRRIVEAASTMKVGKVLTVHYLELQKHFVKGKMDMNSGSVYRSLSLLDTTGKI